MKPKLTDKVKRGLWMIVARSATVFDAENGGLDLDRDEKEAVLAAARYAESHWKQKPRHEEE
jgi:hypothetical protein